MEVNRSQPLKVIEKLLQATEWAEFRELDLKRVKGLLREPVFVDGWNLFEPPLMKKLGFEYYCIGRGVLALFALGRFD